MARFIKGILTPHSERVSLSKDTVVIDEVE